MLPFSGLLHLAYGSAFPLTFCASTHDRVRLFAASSAPGSRTHTYLWLQDHSLALVSIHQHHYRLSEFQESHTAALFYCWLRRQPFPIHRAFAQIRVDREVPNLKRREILKKMTSLGWRNPKIAEACFQDDPRARYFIPFHGNA